MDFEKKKKKTKTSIAIEADKWQQFKIETLREGLEPSAAVERFIDQYLRSRYSSEKAPPEVPPTPYTPEELHKLLDEVLQDGTRHVGAIAANLELLAFALRFVGTHSFEDIRELRKRLSGMPPKPKKKN